MLKYGVDYASPAGANTLRTLKNGYHSFVCRYVSTPGNPKNLTPVEVSACKELGLKVVIVFETTAKRALDGELAGHLDASNAVRQAQNVGISKPVVYFAVDFDARPEDQPRIHSYLQGAQTVLKGRAGVYGGFYVVKRALDAKIVKYAWQTAAWSGGQWDPRAQLRQTANAKTRAGISVDLDVAVHADYGQWPRPIIPRPAPVTKAQLRAKILFWHRHGVSWAHIFDTQVWKLFRKLHGR